MANPSKRPGFSAGPSRCRSRSPGDTGREVTTATSATAGSSSTAWLPTPSSPSSSRPKAQLGAALHLSGKVAADALPTVRLEPCGTATARLVDPAGQAARGVSRPVPPLDGRHPGPAGGARQQGGQGPPSADQDFLYRIDPIHYAERRLRCPGPHHVPRPDPRRDLSGQRQQPSRRQSVASSARNSSSGRGEALDLGDIVIAKPDE